MGWAFLNKKKRTGIGWAGPSRNIRDYFGSYSIESLFFLFSPNYTELVFKIIEMHRIFLVLPLTLFVACEVIGESWFV
jgi:hypothetical protein